MTSFEEMRAIRPAAVAKKSYFPPKFEEPQVAEGFIPVVATGGLGDLVVSLGVCSELAKQTLPVMLWTSHMEAAKFFLETGAYHGICLREDPFPGFDYWIRLNSLATFHFEDNFSGFVSDKVSRLYETTKRFLAIEDWEQVAYSHPGLDNELGRMAIKQRLTRKSLPAYMLGVKEFYGKVPVKGFVHDLEPLITVHDGFEVSQRSKVQSRATKTWNLKHWADLVGMIRETYPKIAVVQLGGQTSRPIPGVTVDMTGRTTMAESLRILSRSKVHIDGDSGLVHAAHALDVRSVVMFGPTPLRFFGYPGNSNISPTKCGNAGNGCWWLRDDWLEKCAMGYESPHCMDSIYPLRVFRAMQEQFHG